MAKIIRHEYNGILDALNKMIVAEVKTALGKLPGKCIKSESDTPLCRIIVSDAGDYRPENVSVSKVTLDAAGELHVWGVSEQYGGCLFDEDGTDWLDITDFGYLIDQIAEKLDDNQTVNVANGSVMTCGYVAESALKQAIEKVF
jgi:hypothetical protein